MQGLHPLKLLFISTSVAPLGTGIGGGVELTIKNLAGELINRGYQLDILAPEGSVLSDLELIQIEGNLQPKAQHSLRTDLPASPDYSVLSNMCTYAKQHQSQYDLIINFSYDWLPIYLTSSFDTPLLHFISMSSLNDAIDFEIRRVATKYPNRLSCNTHTQAKTFPVPEKFTILGKGIDLSKYEFCPDPDDHFIWVGRISREKGLEDAVEAAKIFSAKLIVLGKKEDSNYWDEIMRTHPDANVKYVGFQSTKNMQKILRKSRALLMTPHWIEAFGNVVIEALACGVPVISYRIGGPSEIVMDQVTGFLTKPGNISELVDRMNKIDQIDRKNCRADVMKKYTLESWCNRFEQWIHKSVKNDRVIV
jgi:UDP-glucose:tetrahydrobiopterin glucosyltransferase